MSKIHVDGLVPDRQAKNATFDDREPASTDLTARPHICVTKTIAGGGEFVIDLKESTYGPGLTEFIDVRVKSRAVNMYVDRNDIGDGSVGAGEFIYLSIISSDYKLYRFPIVTDYIRFHNDHHSATPVVTVFIKLKETSE
jgi:hypothetical protein